MTQESERTPTVSRRPYLLRAMYEWICDSTYTPHVIVDAGRPGVEVPTAYVKDGKIVLNLSMSATQHLQLKNEGIHFSARFSGVVHQISVPIDAVMGIYARETGEGMIFSDKDDHPPPPAPPDPPAVSAGPKAKSSAPKRPTLTVVK